MTYTAPQILLLTELYDFPAHPYRVEDDAAMDELMESIKAHGVIAPGLCRPHPDGSGYQIVSGHRRKRACEILGIPGMPFLVEDMSDDEAVIRMVESNFQREKLLPSEKAWAYRMRLEAMKRQGFRSDLTLSQFETKLNSGMELADKSEDSRAKIYRYIRLTYLIPGLLAMADKRDDYGGSLAFGVGVELSYLSESEQKYLEYLFSMGDYMASIEEAKRLRELSEKEEWTENRVIDILGARSRTHKLKMFSWDEKIRRKFPPGTTFEQARETVAKLIDDYHRRWTYAEKKKED
jgi:ParB family chromosome partitioning protein